MSLTVKFYDVEHGSCTHIITPNGKHFLFDIGTKANKSISQYLKKTYFQAQGQIDYLLISHPHLDHIADLENLYTFCIAPRMFGRDNRAFPLKILQSDSPSQISLKHKANEMNDIFTLPIDPDESPLNPSYNGGLDIKLLEAYVTENEANDLNNFSCLLVIRYNGFKIVLTGDNPAKKLDEMFTQYNFKNAIADATILLAPHHGRDSDFCENFVKTVNPRLTIFSDKHIQHETQAHAAQKYSYHTRGETWNGTSRKVLTTRNDGTIIFTFEVDGSWSINTNTIDY